ASGYTINNPFGGTFSFVNQGTYSKTTAGTTVVGVPFTNDSGAIKVDAGKLQFANTFTQIAGSLAVANNSTIQFDGGLSLNSGKLGGSGTLIGNVSTMGEISPGNSAGTFNISGDLSFGSTSVFKVELGGTTQGTDYDLLHITGTASLDGTLSLGFINYFENTAQSTDTFTILDSSALTGQFSNASQGSRITTTDGLGSFIVNYSSIAVSLTDFQAVPEPSTWALLGLGGLLLIYHQNRRDSFRKPKNR
ncbi:MAG: PEP-CTERM sorting domain-containing protein, partial [Cephaloticoccus sp.]|nr:PEP-CTERM sorting domain-containing protein [Cephaloticoccus sp.]